MTHRVDIDALYRRHGHSVLRRARGILRDDTEANEVLQEVFLELLGNPAQFDGRSSVTTYLYSMTTHRCLNRLRNTRNRVRILKESVSAGAAESSREAAADDSVIAREVLADLPEDEARAFVHYHLDEMTHDEIAGLMGCSRRHVGDLLVRAAEHAREASHG